MSFSHIQMTEELSKYLRRISLRDRDLLRRLREETATLPDARMQITPEQGQLMGLLIQLIGAKKALEVGVFTGYSSLSVALALPPDGQLVACDVSEECVRQSKHRVDDERISGLPRPQASVL